MKNDFGKRIKQRRDEIGMSQEELAQKVGYKTRSSISKIEAGERDAPQSMIIAISKALGVTPTYLMGWDEPIESNVAVVLPNESVRMIPVYESVSAGFGAYADNYITEYMPLYIASDEEAENTMVIKVSGDSMYPKIEDGDYVQVLKQDYCEDGQIAVVLIDREEGVVKKIKFDDDATTLISINPEYKPRVFTGAEQEKLRIQGIVRKIIKDV